MTQSLTFSAGVDDDYGNSGIGMNPGTTQAWVGMIDTFGSAVRNWIPFTVNLPRMTIISATLAWVASTNKSGTIAFDIGCEAADNPTVPLTGSNLMSRVQTTAKTNVSPVSYVAGTTYSYDITTAVQEVLNRSGWAYGNTLAVLVVGSVDAHGRLIATVENATYTEPQLTIVFNSYVPRGGNLI